MRRSLSPAVALALVVGVLVGCGVTATGTTSRPDVPAAVTSSTSRPVPDDVLGRVWTTLPVARRRIALTFDCGGNADGVAPILQTLQDKGVRAATFFLTGDWVRVYPAEARAIADAGYLIGNHTDNHLDLTTVPSPQVRGEIRRGRLAVVDATGIDPKPWFRFPYGAYDSRTLGLTALTRWVVIGWSVDTLGWKGTSTGQSVDTALARVLGAARPGTIVLMHVGANPSDHSTVDADALPLIIDQLRALGFRFTTPQVLLTQ